MKKIIIPYGNEFKEFNIPTKNYIETITPNRVQSPQNELDIIKSSINNPIGTKKLNELILKGRKVAIIVDDYTRPTPVYKIIPVLLEILYSAGVNAKDITIIFALGTHRRMTVQEIEQKIGKNISKQYKVINKSVYDHPDYSYVGISKLGVNINVLKEVMDSEVRIGIGSIVPHCDVGFSGGGKIIIPGVGSHETVAQNHIKGLLLEGKNYLGEQSTVIREDIEDIVSRIGLDFIINTVTTLDNKIHSVFSGDYILAQREGIEKAKQVYGVLFKEKVDVAICSSYPGDMDFIQLTKTIWSGEKLLKKGGSLILVTPCYEAMGPYEIIATYMKDDQSNLEMLLNANKVESGLMASLAIRIKRFEQRIKIKVVTEGAFLDYAKEMGYETFNKVEDAINLCLEEHGESATISVLTHGGYTLPILSN